MPRAPRLMPAGHAYHVLNRAHGRLPIFQGDDSAWRFVRALAEAVERTPKAGLLAWCLMPNHWHLVFYPQADDVVQRLLHWFTVTHTQRHRAAEAQAALAQSGDATEPSYGSAGPLYQGRYRSFPIATDEHLLTVLRYVARNPLRAGLVEQSHDWPWSSHYRHYKKRLNYPALSDWPIERPRDWSSLVDRPATAAEAATLERVRHSAQRGTPFGPGEWREQTASKLWLASTMRGRGRPSLKKKDS